MKASRLIFTLLLASSVAVVQLAAQQTKADQKPIEEVKVKAEAGDAESEMEIVIGSNYYEGEEITIYRCDPKKVEPLLSVSCGA